MELHSKKLEKELKDLDEINDADFDSSDLQELKDFSGGNIGKFSHTEQKEKDIN